MLGFAERGKRRLAYGLWRYGEADVETATRMLSLARASGIDHFDTADCYGGHGGFGGSEKLLGTLCKRVPSLFSGATVATKAGVEPGVPYNSSTAYLKAACDASLSRLQVERIDLLYVHRPDFLTHPQELADALDGLVAAGKVATIGVSNFTVAQLDALAKYMRAPIVAHQIEFSAAHVDPLYDGTLDQAMERGIAVAAWSPMAGGKLGEGDPADHARVRETLAKLAAKYDTTSGAIAYAFLLRHPAAVTPIVGTRAPDRLREAVAAAKITLSRADWYGIVESARGERMP